jgi:hypothetical protein
MINININNLCYYFYLNCCVDSYKYTVLKEIIHHYVKIIFEVRKFKIQYRINDNFVM